MARLRSRLALAGTSLLLTLLVAEAAVRCFAPARPLDAEAVWQAQAHPGPHSGGDPWTRVGPFAFREDPLAPGDFDPRVVRLLFLGDSFTEGSGIPDRRDRFSNLVQAHLNAEDARAGRPGRVRIFNGARGGTEPNRWFAYLKVLLPRVKPDAVVAVFFLRDGTRLPTSLRFNQAMTEPIRKRWESRPLYGVSALARFVYDRLAWKEYSETFLAQLSASYLGSEEQRAPWIHQQDWLRRMAELCRDRGIPFHLVIFPLLFDLDHYAFFGVEDEIARFARSEDIPVFSLTPGFVGRDAGSLWVASNDQHPNEEGHRIAAETLLPYVREIVRARRAAGP